MSGEVSINVTFRDSDAWHVQIRQVALGLSPMIMITPEYDADTDSAEFNLDVTDLDREGLATVLGMLAEHLREGDEDEDADA